MMLNKLFLFVFLCINTFVYAHQPDVSTTLLVEKENNTWVLQISASLTAFQQEVRTHFTEYKTPEEFQQMVLDHIKNNLEIKFNDNQNITLSDGIVKLGHETKVVFEVFGIPSEIKTVYMKNSTFKDIYRNQSALVVLKKGFEKEQFVLNNKNNHTLRLVTDDNQFVVQANNEASILSSHILFLLLAVLAVGLASKIIISRQFTK